MRKRRITEEVHFLKKSKRELKMEEKEVNKIDALPENFN